jgi:hypothetical protein
MKPSRPNPLAALAVTMLGLATIQAAGQTAPAELPESGRAGPGLEELDRPGQRALEADA